MTGGSLLPGVTHASDTGGRVRGGATSPRTKNSRGPGARQTGQIQNSA